VEVAALGGRGGGAKTRTLGGCPKSEAGINTMQEIMFLMNFEAVMQFPYSSR
jgi:hypothetical protein